MLESFPDCDPVAQDPSDGDEEFRVSRRDLKIQQRLKFIREYKKDTVILGAPKGKERVDGGHRAAEQEQTDLLADLDAMQDDEGETVSVGPPTWHLADLATSPCSSARGRRERRRRICRGGVVVARVLRV